MGIGLAATPGFPRTLAVLAGIGVSVPIGNRGEPSQASVNLHAWVAYELRDEYHLDPMNPASPLASHWSFLFGPSITFGNVGHQSLTPGAVGRSGRPPGSRMEVTRARNPAGRAAVYGVQPFFFGFLQQSSAVLASLALSLAALVSALAFSLSGFSQSVFSLPFLSLQLDRSGLLAVLAAALASSNAFCFSAQSGLAAASAARAATPACQERRAEIGHQNPFHWSRSPCRVGRVNVCGQ